MFRARKSYLPIALAGAVAGIYLALALGASVCLLASTTTPHHHHDSGHQSHSLLCVWACQVKDDAALVLVAQPPQVWLIPDTPSSTPSRLPARLDPRIQLIRGPPVSS